MAPRDLVIKQAFALQITPDALTPVNAASAHACGLKNGDGGITPSDSSDRYYHPSLLEQCGAQ
jgi:hypothetical protein